MGMSLIKLGDLCAHMQNVTRTKNVITKIPYTKLNLIITYKLLMNGFISSIQKGSVLGPDVDKTVTVTPDNISTRRLWIGLKYRNNQSSLSKMSLISKPSLPIRLTLPLLEKYAKNDLQSDPRLSGLEPIKPGEMVLVREILDNIDSKGKNKNFTLSDLYKNENYGEVMELHEAIAKRVQRSILLIKAH
ncbi:hypothetical protein HANVADRAFT_52848 [Hanseniaspora valbyensis NRRL Y-1626]|uniref:Ribosomal protein S8 n=1 Tax=Hanseniaspora valbyensis NRRL Y-1626 TaxID=766949 RepID=A0A1B7TDS4_9ASCO|nr:hypothetical protein HANVADRAFT_52848 [Hanseniaspora valbyensis NRRL Y-1626]